MIGFRGRQQQRLPTKRRLQLAGVVTTIMVIVAAIIVGVILYVKQRQIIPPSIAHQVSFQVYWPHSSNAVADKKSLKYDSQAQVLSYTTQIQSVHTTVTEQATPSEFTDVPGYFTALVNHLHNYDTFGSSYGSVYLTLPDNTTGETAVMNHSGTLLFAHAQGSLSENSWRQFFNNLKVIEN